MKKLLILILATVLAFQFVACKKSDNNGPVLDGVFTTTTDKFEKKLSTVVSANNELEGFLVKYQGETLIAYVDNKPIGFYVIVADENQNIKSVLLTIETDGPSLSEYRKMLVATFMTLDSGLTYAEAAEISDNLNTMLIFGGDGLEKNGIRYMVGSDDKYASWLVVPAEIQSST